MLSLQVLVSTIDKEDYSLLDKMNIQSDAIVVNQCKENSVKVFEYNGHTIKWISMDRRGVGLSRNTCLMLATADIVLFADQDIRYNDGYAENVIKAFEDEKEADVICFNIDLVNSDKNIGKHRNNTRNKKLHIFNSMRYGATLIAGRTKALRRERISFSLLFGGGAEFSCGEDSVFINDCLKSGLKLFSNVYCLGEVDDSTSTWYTGIDEKFLIDKGIVYSIIFKKIRFLIYVYYAFRLSRNCEYGIGQIYKCFVKGNKIIREYR